MLWFEKETLGFDFEATGVDPRRDRPITAALTRVDPSGTMVEGIDKILDPGVEVPESATAIHGLTTEFLQENGQEPGPAIEEIIEVLDQAIEDHVPLNVFNAKYDFTMLYHEALRHGIEPLDLTGAIVIDPYYIHRALFSRWRGPRQLGVLCKEFGVELIKAHDAIADTKASVDLGRVLLAKAVIDGDFVRTSGGIDPYEEFAAPRKYMRNMRNEAGHADRSLQSYFDSVGKEATIEMGWPILNDLSSCD